MKLGGFGIAVLFDDRLLIGLTADCAKPIDGGEANCVVLR
jgi:hypothetical protein